MKRVIEGKVYNTDTARQICQVRCSCYPGDFHYEETWLYRSPRGVYFLAGSGGPMTRWARPEGSNSWSGGSGLHLIGKDEAISIAEDAEMSPSEMIAAGFEIEEG